MDSNLAEAVTKQIADHDGYAGGQLESLDKQVDNLMEAVGTLSALLVEHTPITIDDLDNFLPSFGYSTIKKDMEDANERS